MIKGGLHKLVQIVQHHSCRGWICYDCPVYEKCWKIETDIPVSGSIPLSNPILKFAEKLYKEQTENWIGDLSQDANIEKGNN